MEIIIKKEINSLNNLISNNLTNFSKLSSKTTNYYSSQGKLTLELKEKRKELEFELNSNLNLVSFFIFLSYCLFTFSISVKLIHCFF